MGWTSHNLRADVGAPLAFAGPAAYLFVTQSNRHVIYLEAEAAGNPSGDLIELYCGTDGIWHVQNLTSKASDAPKATAPPTAYAFEGRQTQHVLFQAGDSHIHEIYWDGDWHHNDLTTAGSAPDTQGQPYGWQYMFWTRQQVVFHGTDGQVHLLSSDGTGNPQWTDRALTRDGDTPCSGNPGGYALEAARTQHVDYRGVDNRLYEISSDNAGNWGRPVDLGAGIADVPTVIDDLPRGFSDEGAGTRHVDFLGDDYNIWEYYFDGGWNLRNLTGTAVGAVSADAGYSPAGYMFEPTPAVPGATQHSIYVGDNAIQELWRYAGGDWHGGALTDPITYAKLKGAAGFADQSLSTQNVFYANNLGEIVELRWEVGETLSFPSHPLQGRH